MQAENSIFVIREAQKQLFDSSRTSGTGKLTPQVIDREMHFPHSTTELRLCRPTQAGLEHFVLHYGGTYRILYLDDCRDIKDLSPLADLHGLEAVCLERCTGADGLWDFSGNTALRILSIRDSRRLVEDPAMLATSLTLEEIRLWGGASDNRHMLESLSCFRGVKSLRRLDLNFIKLKTHDLEVLSELPRLMEFHFDAGMLSTEEITWICAKFPHIYGDCLGVYTTRDASCIHDIRICGHRKPGLDLPKDQQRLDKYAAEFAALVEKYRSES